MPPILQGWDGGLWGDTGQGKGSSQTPGLGSPCCFLHPPFHGLPALPEGIQPPGAVSQQAKGLKPQRWHGGSPKQGARGCSRPPGRAPWAQRGSGRAPRKWGGFGAGRGDLSPDPSAGRAVGSTGRGWPGGRNAGREGNAGKDGTRAGNSRAGKSRGAGVAGLAVSWQRVHPEVALSE